MQAPQPTNEAGESHEDADTEIVEQVDVEPSSNQPLSEEYSKELQALKGDRDLEEEWEKVRLQASRTPGRRGEEIKDDEISKEFIRRLIR